MSIKVHLSWWEERLDWNLRPVEPRPFFVKESFHELDTFDSLMDFLKQKELLDGKIDIELGEASYGTVPHSNLRGRFLIIAATKKYEE